MLPAYIYLIIRISVENNMNDYHLEAIRARYQLVPRTLVFIRNKDSYLLIHKAKKDSYGFGKLNGIGGHMEKGEDPYQSARREIREETGLVIDALELAAILLIDINANPGIQIFIFRTQWVDGEFSSSLEGELLWVERELIQDNDKVDKDLPFLMEQVEAYKSGTPPRIIQYSYDEFDKLRIAIIM